PPATAWAPSARRQATERAPGGARITGAPARPGAEAAVRDHGRSRQRRETVAEAPVSRLAAPPARGQVTPDRSTQPLRSTPQQTRRAPEARTPVQAPAPQPRTRAQTHTRGTAPAVGARASAPPASSPGPAPRESTARETTQRGTSQRQATPRQATPRLGAPARDAGSARGRSAERGRGGGRREVD
ncbi:MAG: hypothetical protein JJT93_06175, partial [Gammaproteobacteria bacterium]|nr:hypothetical protein [Gammaproteobacteria bacterium]